jgi:hypothetical protein
MSCFHTFTVFLAANVHKIPALCNPFNNSLFPIHISPPKKNVDDDGDLVNLGTIKQDVRPIMVWDARYALLIVV